VAPTNLLPKNGVARPPHFWPSPTASMGWPKPPPGPWGWSGHPKRPKRKKERKKERMGLGFWGWSDHPLGPGGGFGHSIPAVRGGQSHPQALRGGPATPKGKKKKGF
jgi:hypothetical protein